MPAADGSLPRAQICAVCDEYLAAVSSGDLERIVSLFSEDARIEDPVGIEPSLGREGARQFYAQNNGIDLQLSRLGPVTVVGSRAAFQLRVEVAVGSTVRRMTSTDVVSLDSNGHIRSLTAYPDPDADPDGL